MITQSANSVSHPPLQSAQDIASNLGITVSQVYRLARAGSIPCYKLGRYVRFSYEDILKATAHAVPPEPVRHTSALVRLQAYAKRGIHRNQRSLKHVLLECYEAASKKR